MKLTDDQKARSARAEALQTEAREINRQIARELEEPRAEERKAIELDAQRFRALCGAADAGDVVLTVVGAASNVTAEEIARAADAIITKRVS